MQTRPLAIGSMVDIKEVPDLFELDVSINN